MFALSLLAALTTASGAAAPVDAYPDVARAYWVEVDGAPLWAGHADARLPPASLTKLMTALLADEALDAQALVEVGAAAAAETGTRAGLRRGERFRAGELVAAMLVRSANDACHALADAVAGDEAAFVVRMNARAAALALADTHYANACGHDDAAQYSSARDLARLSHAVLARPALVEAAAQREARLTSLDGRRLRLRSTNALLDGLPGARGLKTGTTPGAGRCLVAVVERDGVQVLAVLLHAPDRWWDSVGLIGLAFDAPRQGKHAH